MNIDNKFSTGVSFLLGLSPLSVYLMLLGILILCGFGLPIPEDIILITGGYLAYEDLLNVHVMNLVGLVGVLLGDSTMFLLGKKYGQVLLSNEYVSKVITHDKVEKAKDYVQKYGNRIFFIARFLPGLRSPIFFTGGTLKSNFFIFFLYDGLAALISVPVWVYSAYYFGEYIYKVIVYARNAQAFILGTIFLVIFYKLFHYYRNYRNKNKNRNR